MTALDNLVAALEQHGCRPRQSSSGQWAARCPAHHDRNPSLSFTQKEGKVLILCHAGCLVEDVIDRLGIGWPELFDEETREWQTDGARVVGVSAKGRPMVIESFARISERVERTKRRAIVTRDLREAMAKEPDEPQWLWDGYLAAGWITLLAGLPKTGKTTLLCGLLDAFAREKEFLGRTVRPTGTLLLTEQAPGVFKSTIGNYGLAFANVEAAFYREQETFDWSELISGAIDVCQDKQLGLLVIDTFARWASMETDHDAAEILRTLAPLAHATKAGLAVLIVHHQRKQGGAHGTEVSGRVEITAAVDVIISLARLGEQRKLSADGRSTATPEQVVFEVDAEGGFRLVGTSTAREVEDALKQLGEATYLELAEATDLSRRSVLRAVDELKGDGRIVDAGTRGRAKVFRLAAGVPSRC